MTDEHKQVDEKVIDSNTAIVNPENATIQQSPSLGNGQREIEHIKRQLRLKSKIVQDINEELQECSHSVHHRAIVLLLTCLAAQEIYDRDGAPSGNALMTSYKRFVELYKQAVPSCRTCPHLMVTTLGRKRKQLSAQNLSRKLRREITPNFQKIEKFFHDYTPKNKNKTYQQILHEVCQWWHTQQSQRLLVAKQSRKTKKSNPGRAKQPPQWSSFPNSLSGKESTRVTIIRRSYDPFVPLIARFCPNLCESLGFPKGLTCVKTCSLSSLGNRMATPTGDKICPSIGPRSEEEAFAPLLEKLSMKELAIEEERKRRQILLLWRRKRSTILSDISSDDKIMRMTKLLIMIICRIDSIKSDQKEVHDARIFCLNNRMVIDDERQPGEGKHASLLSESDKSDESVDNKSGPGEPGIAQRMKRKLSGNNASPNVTEEPTSKQPKR